jgi:hypothetical protein
VDERLCFLHAVAQAHTDSAERLDQGISTIGMETDRETLPLWLDILEDEQRQILEEKARQTQMLLEKRKIIGRLDSMGPYALKFYGPVFR